MTSDFDNDDIQESSFPLEIDEAGMLDQYGVWIKTGPRDIGVGRPEVPNFDEGLKNRSVSSDSLNPALVKPVFVSDIDAEQLPDFVLPDFELGPLEPRASIDEQFFDEQKSSDDLDFSINKNVYNSIQPENESSFLEEEPITNENFEDIAFDDFDDKEDVSVPEMPDSLDEDATVEFMDIPVFDQKDRISKSDEHFTDTSQKMNVIFDDEASTPVEPVISDSEDLTASSIIDESDFVNYASSHDHSKKAMPATEFSEEILPETFTSTDSHEDNFSSFLDDLNSMSTPSDAKKTNLDSGTFDDLDLDSFIDSFNETGGAAETEQLFDDDDPVDIVLDFDEDYINTAEKIKAAGAVPESEFYDPDFGVDLIDETGVNVTDTTDLDRILSVVPDKSEFETDISLTSGQKTQNIEFTTEFDDFLGDIDSKSAPVLNAGVGNKSEKTSFNLDVVEDESPASVAAPVTESTTEEDLSVSLFETGYTPSFEVPDDSVVQMSERTSTSYDEADGDEKIEFLGIEGDDIGDVDISEGGSIEDSVQNFTDDIRLDDSETDDQNLYISFSEPQKTDTLFQDEESVLLTPSLSPGSIFQTEPGIDDQRNSEIDLSSTLAIDQEENVAFTSPPVYTDDRLNSFGQTVPITFDDISAVEHDLQDETSITEGEDIVGVQVSADLLKKIAEELALIKSELAELKSDLGKGGGAVLPLTQTVQEDSGFFTDDDPDETIALTGDELNNILITADFTEEKEVATVPSSTDVSDTTPGSSISISVTNDFDLPKDPDVPDTLPEELFAAPSVAILNEIEIRPVTSLRDDISYLEGSEEVEPTIDEVAIDESDIETIDFNDEKLEEPILDEFSIDLGDMEASFAEIKENMSASQAIVRENDITVGELENSRKTTITSSEPDILVQPDFIAESADKALDEAMEEVDLSIAEPFSLQSPDFSGFDDVPSEDEVTVSEAFDDNGTVFEQAPDEADDFVEIVDEPVRHDQPVDSAIHPNSALKTEPSGSSAVATMPVELKEEIKSVLSYMDQLLESLPEEKIEEFANSEHFDVYKRLFEELGIS